MKIKAKAIEKQIKRMQEYRAKFDEALEQDKDNFAKLTDKAYCVEQMRRTLAGREATVEAEVRLSFLLSSLRGNMTLCSLPDTVVSCAQAIGRVHTTRHQNVTPHRELEVGMSVLLEALLEG